MELVQFSSRELSSLCDVTYISIIYFVLSRAHTQTHANGSRNYRWFSRCFDLSMNRAQMCMLAVQGRVRFAREFYKNDFYLIRNWSTGQAPRESFESSRKSSPNIRDQKCRTHAHHWRVPSRTETHTTQRQFRNENHISWEKVAFPKRRKQNSGRELQYTCIGRTRKRPLAERAQRKAHDSWLF